MAAPGLLHRNKFEEPPPKAVKHAPSGMSVKMIFLKISIGLVFGVTSIEQGANTHGDGITKVIQVY